MNQGTSQTDLNSFDPNESGTNISGTPSHLESMMIAPSASLLRNLQAYPSFANTPANLATPVRSADVPFEQLQFMTAALTSTQEDQSVSSNGSSPSSPVSNDDEGKPVKPRRPLTAYNLYFRYERSRILGTPLSIEEVLGDSSDDDQQSKKKKKRKHEKTHGKIGFTDLVQLVSKRWKALDYETKAIFQAKADKESEKYRKDLKEYKREHRRWSDTKFTSLRAKIQENFASSSGGARRNSETALQEASNAVHMATKSDHISSGMIPNLGHYRRTTPTPNMRLSPVYSWSPPRTESVGNFEPVTYDGEVPPPITDADMSELRIVLGDRVIAYLSSLDE